MDISFLIPVYNASRFIEDCIRSIAAQGLESYEILALDDCSKDDSYEKLRGLCRTYPQLQVFRNAENSGVSYTRNRLIEMATGQYIQLIDADDMLAPGSAARLLELARAHDADYLSGNYIPVPEDTRFDPEGAPPAGEVCVEAFPDYELSTPHHASTEVPISVIWGGCVRRSFLEDHRLRFREDLRYREDTMFLFEASLVACKAYHCNVLCYYYRTNSMSITHVKSIRTDNLYYANLRTFHDLLRDYAGDPTIPALARARAQERLYHLQPALAITLCHTADPVFVKAEMKKLKQEGLYPYKGRKEVLSAPGSPFVKRLALYMMHSAPAWWLMHRLYYKKSRR